MRRDILTRFSLDYLYPHQELAIHYAVSCLGLAGDQARSESRRGLLLCLPTGSGKSICFSAPASLVEGVSVILYPLNALLRDQREKFRRAGIAAVAYCGAMDIPEKQHALEEIRRMHKGAILTNAESASRAPLLPLLFEKQVKLLVIDEAHLVLQWGGSFRPELLKILHIRQMLDDPVTIACTATISRDERTILGNLLWREDSYETIELLCDRKNIHYRSIGSADQLIGLQYLLSCAAEYRHPPASPVLQALAAEVKLPMLVFLSSRRRCEELAARARIWFRQWGRGDVDIWYYHAGLSSSRRREIEARYAQSDRALAFVTKAFGTGLDLPGVRCCLHADCPESMEDFLQESGRAGRDGKPAFSVLLQTGDGMFAPGRCRRRQALESIDQEPEYCAGCDVCDGTEAAESLEELILQELRDRQRIRGYLENDLLGKIL